jgi:hypothetical protein
VNGVSINFAMDRVSRVNGHGAQDQRVDESKSPLTSEHRGSDRIEDLCALFATTPRSLRIAIDRVGCDPNAIRYFLRANKSRRLMSAPFTKRENFFSGKTYQKEM